VEFLYTFVLINFNVKHLKQHQMNKAELVDAIASETQLSKVDSQKALDAFVNATTKALKKGDRVALVGFGSFSVSKRAARNGRNPQTGKAIKIAAKKVAKFKAGAELATTVNK
jgi:DNA-binding protein HU-beta